MSASEGPMEGQSGRHEVRQAALEMSGEDFRVAGHALVDRIADWLEHMPDGPVTPGESRADVRAALAAERGLPVEGAPAGELLEEAAELLFAHSLFNGHPRFLGYITSSAAPIGALADLLAAAVNPNVGGWQLSPMATEIEDQCVRWIAEAIGYPGGCGGLLTSGGNVANLTAFAAARVAKADWNVRSEGMAARGARPMAVYGTAEVHTWLEKACDITGLGTAAMRRVPADTAMRMDVAALESAILADRDAGVLPAIVVASAGTVSTGAVDPLPALREVCDRHGLWLHADGAYGAFAALAESAPAELRQGLALADSVALDPHKWLYSPLEAGCTLVRDPGHLLGAFAYRPDYYEFGAVEVDAPTNYYELGPQNSRGFRALKVWLGLRQAGRDGYAAMIEDDIALAERLHAAAEAHPEIEAIGRGLSITTFRYRPPDTELDEAALSELNQALLLRLQTAGRYFLSNAVLGGRYVLRACVVNFRTTAADMDALPQYVAELGRALLAERSAAGDARP